MRIFNTAGLDQALMKSLSRDAASNIYCGLDCCVTLEVYQRLMEELDDSPEHVRYTYDMALAKQAPILEMSMRGINVDLKARDAAVKEIEAVLEKLDSRFQRIMREVFEFELNWRSPTQLKNLFYGCLNIKEIKKRNTKGQYAATVNEEALNRLCTNFWAQPLALYILKMRELNKKLGFFKTELDEDGRIRCNINIAGTNTGRLSSSFNDFGTGCVKPTAEVLTPQGWRTLRSLCDGELIAQWDQGEITFVPATVFWTSFDGELETYSTEQTQLAVTPGHRVLSRHYHSEYQVTAAGKLAGAKQQYIPLAGKKRDGLLRIPAYAAALMADCSKEGTVWRTQLKKECKISRLLSLLDKAGIEYKETKARDGYRRFTIYADITLPKVWGPWVLDLAYEDAKELVEEARYWDSHSRGKSFIFYSASKEQAEWFQTLCHLVGKSTTMRAQRNSDEAYGNNSIIYAVNVKPKDEAQVLSKHWGKEYYKGLVGCPSVPSSFWLVRENGFISVTGNTNLQNVDTALRFAFIPDPDYIMVNIDLEQADARNVGAIIYNMFYESHGPEVSGKYLDACESGDLHTFVCRMAWAELDWPEDRSGWRSIADQTAYRAFSYRDLAKRLGHGTNYYGTPFTMAKHTHTETRIIEQFQKRYFEAFPLIQKWHEKTIELLKTDGFLTTPYGRRRFFFGRGDDASTWRKGIAYCPQSMTGHQIDMGLLNLWREMPEAQLLMQVHDSILFQVPYEGHAEYVNRSLELLKYNFHLKGGRNFYVPLEAKVGWNWGDTQFDKKGEVVGNAYGLRKWKGEEKRLPPVPTEKRTLKGIM